MLDTTSIQTDPEASVPKDDETSRLEFSWSCMVGMVIGYNETELLEAEECNLTITDDWTQNPVIEAEGDLLEEGSYTFRVKVRRVNLHEQNRTSESPPASGPPDPRGPDGAPVRPDPESPHGEGWWVVHVRRRAIPVVQLQVPWADGDEVSVARNLEPAIAHVSGSMACPIPNDWAWHWVLIDDAYVLALMKTTVQLDRRRVLQDARLAKKERHMLIMHVNFKSLQIFPSHTCIHKAGLQLTKAGENHWWCISRVVASTARQAVYGSFSC